jgi:glyoxylase-like metal-dependent hydrolase (beta-lactamase superfamily II)
VCEVRPHRRGRGAELADPRHAAVILIIRTPCCVCASRKGAEDGQFAPFHDKIKAAIAAISPLPIKYLINTHFHGDHTGGNEA